MMRYLKPIAAALVVMAVTGCDSDNTASEDSVDFDNLSDAYIDDVPLMADSFVLMAFALEADGDPLVVDNVELKLED